MIEIHFCEVKSNTLWNMLTTLPKGRRKWMDQILFRCFRRFRNTRLSFPFLSPSNTVSVSLRSWLKEKEEYVLPRPSSELEQLCFINILNFPPTPALILKEFWICYHLRIHEQYSDFEAFSLVCLVHYTHRSFYVALTLFTVQILSCNHFCRILLTLNYRNVEISNWYL